MDGQKVLLSIRNMGGESTAAWSDFLGDLDVRGLCRPEFVIVDGAPGLEAALAQLWGRTWPSSAARFTSTAICCRTPRSIFTTRSVPINLGAPWQTDVRRLIGWSSVSQSGYALMAVAVADLAPRALPSLLWFLAAYAPANITTFAVVAHLRGRTELSGYKGLARTRPGMAAALIVAFLSLVAIPPLIGFTGKLGPFIATIDGGYTWLALAAVLNTVASPFYYARVIGPMYFAAPQGAHPATLGRATGALTLLCAGGLIALGIFTGPFLGEAMNVALQP